MGVNETGWRGPVLRLLLMAQRATNIPFRLWAAQIHQLSLLLSLPLRREEVELNGLSLAALPFHSSFQSKKLIE